MILDTVMVVCRLLAAFNYPADRSVEERMYTVVEWVKRCNRMLILILDRLRYDLKAIQHRTFCSGIVLSGSSVLPYFRKNLLDQDELIWHKRIVLNKFLRSAVSFDIQNGIRKAEEVLQYIVVSLIQIPEDSCGFRLLGEESFLNDFINRGGGQGKPRLETCLNAGELIHADLNDLIDGFLTCADDPHLAAAFAADFFYERLKVQEQIRIGTDVLADLIDHEEKTEVLWLAIDIFLYL